MIADSDGVTVGEMLLKHGISRRGFIQYCTAVASAMALPPWMGPAMADQLRTSPGRASCTCRSRSARAVWSP